MLVLAAITYKQVIMILAGLGLIWLGIKKEYEPALLIPIGFGAILVNIPFSSALTQLVDGKIQEG
ncbi:MAG TPA: sodium ion-translocating decarboxylase subunit beta, partial [Synergistaceae bacterium]|nr:sodium ion-translocating decarboxylase subunit beta [Synergistaceae bacterium]